jgi:Cu2+-exporting ATPase
MPGSSSAIAALERLRVATGLAPTAPVDTNLPDSASRACFHCGQPNPGNAQWRAVCDGAERRFCCAGCLGVAQTIRAAGLEQFYRRCDVPGGPPQGLAGTDESARTAAAAEAAGLVLRLDDDLRETSLLLEGIRCAACVWLSETYLQRQPGVVAVSVNFATRRARVRWDSRQTQLAALLRAIAAIGYRAYPYDPARREALARKEARALLARTALALLAMMQVMMFAVPGYLSVDGVEHEYQRLLNWASFALTLPVVLYSAAPFFAGTLRDLRLHRLGMDLPVALGVGGGFVASAWATWSGAGAVYYDSVTMFVALLLVARFVELRARQRAGDAIEAIARDLPELAERIPDYPGSLRAETVTAAALRPGDTVRVAMGASIPADGEVIEGRSSVEEALLTGESWPRVKTLGHRVLAGSINRESPLLVRVIAAGAATTRAALARLVERAAGARPRAALLADRVAAWFVAGLLAVAAVTGIVWWQLEPERALAVTFAVLVVSCPCALSLATPAALAAAAGALGRRLILAVRSDALEALSRVTHVVVDKTGTLTTGHVELVRTEPLSGRDAATCVALAAALEQGSEHPIARALRGATRAEVGAQHVTVTAGSGVEGVIAGRRHRLGRPDWVAGLHGAPLPAVAVAPDVVAVALGDESGWLAWLSFSDTLRPTAPTLIASLHQLGLGVSLVSGDRLATVQNVAEAIGIADFHGDQSPEAKRAFVAALQHRGERVAMVGDGINDAPSLAQADVSLALGCAATLTQWTADVVVLGDDLGRIAEAFARARQAFRVIHQNLLWALAYNLVAIPLAATGHVSPLVAALGMVTSSLLVVANSLRLLRRDAKAEATNIARRSPALAH